jgi:hypothetical protein
MNREEYKIAKNPFGKDRTLFFLLLVFIKERGDHANDYMKIFIVAVEYRPSSDARP